MCFEFDARPPEVPAGRVLPGISGGAAAESLTLTSGDGSDFAAAVAESPESRGPAVIILPDVRGLYRFYIELAERFAETGHHAVAIDYFGRTAGVEERGEDFDYMAHLRAVEPGQVQEDIAAARGALAERTSAAAFVTIGFCFGGAQSFIAGTNGSIGIDAVIGFYGTLNADRIEGMEFLPSPLREATEIRLPLLGLFGGADDFIPAEDIKTFDEALESTGVEHEIKIYPGAPHSFFDRSFDQYAKASADAWNVLLEFLGRLQVAANA